MKKSIHIISSAILALGLSSAWAEDVAPANKPGMDKEHMEQMHKHMDEMHKSNNMDKANGMGDTTKGDMKCDMKSDGKCAAKDMKPMGKSAADKPKAPANADDHSVHHE